MNDEKKKALEQAIAQIEKTYGKGSIMKMDEDAFGEGIEVIPMAEYIFKDLFFKEKNCKLRFDFAIFNQDGSFSHLVEYDGPQHFKEGVRESGWNTLNNYYETVERDKLKNEYCELNNIKLIRIKYNEDFDLKDILGKEEKNDFNE